MYCPKCGAYNDDLAMFCTQCGAALAQNAGDEPYQEQTPAAPMPMGWYKFLIYFSLFASAVINVINGFTCLRGTHYGDVADLVYAMFGGLKTVDLLMAVASFALAAFSIYVRFRLAQYRQDGPTMLTWLYVASIAVSILYIVGVAAVLPAEVRGEVVSSSVSSAAPSAVVAVVMIFVNRVYFKNRAHLFNT